MAEDEIPGVKKVQVVRNTIDLPGVRVAGTAPDEAPAKDFFAGGRLCALGNFPVKDQDLLIRTGSELHLTKPRLQLLLAGADDERRGVRNAC